MSNSGSNKINGKLEPKELDRSFVLYDTAEETNRNQFDPSEKIRNGITGFDEHCIKGQNKTEIKLNQRLHFSEKEWKNSLYKDANITDFASLYLFEISDGITKESCKQIFSHSLSSLIGYFKEFMEGTDSSNQLLRFTMNDSNIYLVLREWKNRIDCSILKDSKAKDEDLKKWILLQIQRYNKLKLAGSNSHIFTIKDFYFVCNKSESFYFADFVFEVRGYTLLAEIQGLSFEFWFCIFSYILQACLYLNHINMYFKEIPLDNIYIKKYSGYIDIKIIPFHIATIPKKVEGKENNSYISNSERQSNSKPKNLQEINCRFTDGLSEKFERLLENTLIEFDKNKNNLSNYGNQISNSNSLNGKEISYKKIPSLNKNLKLIDEKEIIINTLTYFQRKRIISVPQYEQFVKLCQSNKIYLLNPSEIESLDLLKESIEKVSQRNSCISVKSMNFGNEQISCPSKSSSEYIQKEKIINNQASHFPDIIEESKEENSNYLNNQSSINQYSEFSNNLLKLYWGSFEQLQLNGKNLLETIRKLANLIIIYTNQQLSQSEVKIPFENFEENIKVLKKRFNCLKYQVGFLETENEFTLRTEQKVQRNETKMTKVIYFANAESSNFNNNFCIILDSKGEIYLGEYEMNNQEITLSGFGFHINNFYDKDYKLYLGNISHNKKNGFGYKPDDSKYFFGNYKNGKKDDIGLFFYSNNTYDGGIYLNGKLTEDQIKGDSTCYYRGTIKEGKEDGLGKFIWFCGDTYQGECSEGEIEGQGRLEKNNGEYQDGIFHKGVFDKGFTKIMLPNENIYEGHYENKELNGLGKMIYPNGEIYEGDFANRQKEGKGKQTYPGNGYYNGEWHNNERNGNGERYYNDNKIYIGNWVEGLKEGEGNFRTSEYSYKGHFKNNKFDGSGTLKKSNEEYIGVWENGKQQGKGKLYVNNRLVYEGDFSNDFFEGKGKYYEDNGNIYEGYFIKGKKTGKGLYTKPNREKYEGDFLNDAIHGTGKYTYQSGSVFEGSWVNGRREGLGSYKFKDIEIKAQWSNDVLSGDFEIIFKNPHNTIYKGRNENKTENEIITQFINLDADRYIIRERPFLNGYYEIIYSNGSRLKGNFIDGLLTIGTGKIILREKNGNIGENVQKHLNIQMTQFLNYPCMYDGEIQNGQLNGESLLTYLELEKSHPLYNSNTYKYILPEIHDLKQNQIPEKVIWENNKVKEAKQMLIILSENKIYYGQILNDKFHGTGKLYEPNGDYSQGQFINGIFDHGKVRKALPNKCIFEGQLVKGIPSGIGRIISEYTIYEGEVNPKFQMHGKGISTYMSFEKFKHLYKDHPRLNELETFFFENLSFNGTFENDVFIKGKGTLVYAKEGIYNGMIENKTRTDLGEGRMYYLDGFSYIGQWENNLHHGEGEYRKDPNICLKGKWIKGEYQDPSKNLKKSTAPMVPYRGKLM